MGDGPSKYSGTVVGVDGCAYGIVPFQCNRIVKYDPINDIISYLGRITKKYILRGWGFGERQVYLCDHDMRFSRIQDRHNQ